MGFTKCRKNTKLNGANDFIFGINLLPLEVRVLSYFHCEMKLMNYKNIISEPFLTPPIKGFNSYAADCIQCLSNE